MQHDSRPDPTRAAQLYLTLSADGAASAGDQRSLTRRLALLLAALLLAVAAPLGWSAVADADGGGNGPQAVLAKSDDPGEDDDEGGDDTTDNDGTNGESGDDSTKGQTGGEEDADTGRETQAQKTDRRGLDTGVSTKGETDPGDHTGKTERR
ncbi:MAG: hypothetical protein ACRDK0_07365 [Solirubrobacteraceae bacterium]